MAAPSLLEGVGQAGRGRGLITLVVEVVVAAAVAV